MINPKSEILSPKQCSNFQNSNVQNQLSSEHWKIRIPDLFRISILEFRIFSIVTLFLFLGTVILFAQTDSDALASLAQKIMDSKPQEDARPLLDQLAAAYFKGNKYDDCAAFLKSLIQKRADLEAAADYYIALARFTQLKYLEDSQGWDEYFSQGNSYREELEGLAQKASAALGPENRLRLSARLLLWRFHNDQQDALRDSALSSLMDGVAEFSRAAAPEEEVLKEVADQLFTAGEKLESRQVYRRYVEILTRTESNDSNLKAAALKFYSEGNYAISEEIFNAYLQRREKSGPKEALIVELLEIAKLFSADDSGQKDAAFSEEMFKKTEALGGSSALSENLSYLRAYNLEKAKEFLAAKEAYINLLRRFAESVYSDEANFKIGIISVYVARDLTGGRAYFEKLAQQAAVSPQVVSSLYQLGLLSHWENDLAKAKEYYGRVLEKAKDGFIETVNLTKERLKEIEENKPIEYNLKLFLDVSLKKESFSYDIKKLELDSTPYRSKPADNVNIHALDYPTDSGCMQPQLQYLWSGHLGRNERPAGVKSFDTSYNHKGTKEINLVVVSPQETLDYSIDMVDID
jgi:TolA-binding protein